MRVLSDEVGVASGEHDAGIATDKQFGKDVEIAEHGITYPMPNDTNFIGVKASKEKCHCTAAIIDGQSRMRNRVALLVIFGRPP